MLWSLEEIWREERSVPPPQCAFSLCCSLLFCPFSHAALSFLSCKSSWSWRMGLAESVMRVGYCTELDWVSNTESDQKCVYGCLASWEEMGKRGPASPVESSDSRVHGTVPCQSISLWAGDISLWLNDSVRGCSLTEMACPLWVLPAIHGT